MVLRRQFRGKTNCLVGEGMLPLYNCGRRESAFPGMVDSRGRLMFWSVKGNDDREKINECRNGNTHSGEYSEFPEDDPALTDGVVVVMCI